MPLASNDKLRYWDRGSCWAEFDAHHALPPVPFTVSTGDELRHVVGSHTGGLLKLQISGRDLVSLRPHLHLVGGQPVSITVTGHVDGAAVDSLRGMPELYLCASNPQTEVFRLGTLSGLAIRGLTKTNLPLVGQLDALVVLALPSCNSFRSPWLDQLTGMRGLERLLLEGTSVDDAAVARLHRWPKLASLDLSYTKITDDGLRDLASMPLRHLRLAGLEVGDAGLEAISRLGTLAVLDLDGAPFYEGPREEAFSRLCELSSLKRLVLPNRYVGDRSLVGFEKLALMELVLSGTRVTADGIAHLDGRNLRELDVDRTPLGREALERIGTFSRLRRLDLTATRIADADLVHLGRLRELEELRIGATDISDEGLRHLASLSALRTLSLGMATRFSPAGVGRLRELPELQSVSVQVNTSDAFAQEWQTLSARWNPLRASFVTTSG